MHNGCESQKKFSGKKKMSHLFEDLLYHQTISNKLKLTGAY